MTTRELAQVLLEFGVDPLAFDFDDGRSDETYCLTKENDGWHVFYSERGTRTNERVFETECAASDAVLQDIASDPLSRTGARRAPLTER